MFNEKKEKNNNNMLFITIIVLLIIIAIGAFFLGKKQGNTITGDTPITGDTEIKGDVVEGKDLTITIIDDKRCVDCSTDIITNRLKELPFLVNANYVEKDFTDEGVKKYLKENKLDFLPAIVLSTNNINDPENGMKPYLQELKSGEYSLQIGSSFDPYAEICDNGIDDNSNSKIDCADESCKKQLVCAPKVDKPKAELFIMSYCPYGTQAQKGYLEAMLKLKGVADMKVRFVQYLMHGDKEGQENIVQHCIQKEQDDKYMSYLQCFLKDGEKESCRKEVKINENKLQSCIDSTKKEIDYDTKFADKSKKFPDFDIDREDAMKYRVQGSPSFVLNGIKIDKIGRSAKAYADIICNSFKEKPEVCNEEFSSTTYDPNFGFTSNGQVVEGGCGG